MNILFVTDLHGIEWKYKRVLQIAKKLDVEAVINGGDLFPHSRGAATQPDFIAYFLDDHLAQYDSAGIHYLCYPGNDDLKIHDEMFEKVCDKYSRVVPLAQRKFDLGGFEFIGMNWVVDYPFRLKDRCRRDTEDYVFQPQLGPGVLSTPDGYEGIDDWFAYAATLPTIEEEMERLVRPTDMEKAVYVIHMPPSDLGLDECTGGERVGSRAIYRFLEKNQPRLSLHGHIHESPLVSGRWKAQLGRTLAVQPGNREDLAFAVIDLESMECRRSVEAQP
jgi:Icc-related predicted phosphoesterase